MQRKFLQSLLSWKEAKNRKPLLIKGVRQVGKTFLLKELGSNHFPNYHYFNFEQQPELGKIFSQDLVPRRILKELSFHTGASIEVGKDLVIFDEIQEVPKALTSLKYFAEDCPELHICGAGSLLGIHLNGGSFPVGKVVFETLYPLSFEEFLLAKKDKAVSYVQNFGEKGEIPPLVHEHLWEQLKQYFIIGGLPEVVLIYLELEKNPLEAFSAVRKKQQDLLQSYYADMAKHSGKINAMHIDRVFRSICHQISQVQDESIARFKFKGVIPGVTHYDRMAGAIDWLEKAGLAIKVPIVNRAELPLLGYTKENCFKLLLFDIGILGAMAHLSFEAIMGANYGSYKGYFAENFVAQELLASGYPSLFSWQEGKAKIEFLLEAKAKVVPLEVKSGNVTKAKSLQAFSDKYHPFHKIISSAKPFMKRGGKAVEYFPLYLMGKLRERLLKL